jgi:hypothetical protein
MCQPLIANQKSRLTFRFPQAKAAFSLSTHYPRHPHRRNRRRNEERRNAWATADVWNRLDVGLTTLSLEIVGQVYEAMLERSTAKSPGRRRSRSPSEVRAGGWVFARSGLISLKRPSMKWLETAFAEDVGGALLRL